MKIVVTGATGFIGKPLCNELATGHNVIALTRSPQKASELLNESIEIVKWDAVKLSGWERCLEYSDVIVHLAGTNVASARWNKKIKSRIIDSRIHSSRLLIQAVKNLQTKPKTIVIASATGFYGSRADEQLYEESENGLGFLAALCRKIEDVSKEFENLNIRTIIIRTGIVLDASGGALSKMIKPFKFYIGGFWGSGKQWISWISLSDEIEAIKFLIRNENLNGVFNLTSPQPLENRQFLQILASVLKKPCWLFFPAFALKIIFGQMADELFLTSQRVYPRKLINAGFEFKYPDLKDALKSMKFKGDKL